MRSLLFSGVCLLLGGTAGDLRADLIIVPAANASVEGNSYALPLSINDPFSERFQQVYSASAFGELLPSGGGWIREITFRSDGPLGSPFDATFTNVQVNLSTTARAPDGLSPFFSENVGHDDMVVRGSGPITLSGGPAEPGQVSPFVIGISFTTPYFYNPANGNLLLDIRNIRGLPVSPFDAVDVIGDAVGSVFAYDWTLPETGTPSSVGLVTLFAVDPIPEPSTLALFGIGVSLVGWFKLKRKKGGP